MTGRHLEVAGDPDQNNPEPAIGTRVNLFQGASNVAVEGVNINAVGRDMYVQYHIYPEDKLGDAVKISKWLSSIKFNAIQNDTFAKRTSGTGLWFLESAVFKEWALKDEGILWGFGMPGAGKTIISSLVIDHIQKNYISDEVCLVFAYCQYQEKGQYTTRDILAALVKQLVQYYPKVLPIVQKLYSAHEPKETMPLEKELMVVLQDCFALFTKRYILFDALDEYEKGLQLELITNLLSLPRSCLFITSRPLALFKDPLLTGTVFSEIQAKNEDIQLFIVDKLERMDTLSTITKGKQSIMMEIASKVKQKSNGMFLMAALQIETLKECTTVNELRDALNSLPTGVNEMYGETIKRIQGQGEKRSSLAIRAILWLTFAYRTLEIEELLDALRVKLGASSDLTSDDDVPQELLVSISCGLITIDNENESFRLIHYTAQEFFIHFQLDLRWPHPHSFIANICTTYLSLHKFAEQGHPRYYGVEFEQYLKSKPLLQYAYNHWALHMRACNSKGVLKDELLKFVVSLRDYPWVPAVLYIDYYTPLHVVAAFGLTDVLPLLQIHHQPSIHYKNTPLHVASRHGHEEIVKALLQDLDRFHYLEWPLLAGMRYLSLGKINAMNDDGHTALMIAAIRGHESLIKLLLSNSKIDVNAQRAFVGTALILAITKGRNTEAVVKLLLGSKRINVNAHTYIIGTALTAASDWKYRNEAVVVQLLACKGINVNFQDSDGTALIRAVNAGDEAVVKSLLSFKCIDVNARDMFGKTALMAASGSEGMTKLILNFKGVDIGDKDEDGNTAFILASIRGNITVLELLLNSNLVDVNARNNKSDTAFTEASAYGCEGFLKLLFTHNGVNFNTRNYNGDTALTRASSKGHEAVVSILLSSDKIDDVGAANNDGNTALALASFGGHKEAVIALLQSHRIDCSAQNHNGDTALTLASLNGHEAVVELLLASDKVDASSKNNDGNTALAMASSGGHELVVRLLLETTSNVDILNSQNKNGDTALAIASSGGYEAVVKLLLAVASDSIDINCKNNDGDSALIRASHKGSESVVKALLDCNGIDVNVQNNKGDTSITLAFSHKHEEVAKLLLASRRIDFRAKNKDGHTVFAYAAYREFNYYQGEETAIDMLLHDSDAVDSINIGDNKGNTPLMLASWNIYRWSYQWVVPVELLLSCKTIDVNATNNNGDTALIFAAFRGRTKVVELLINHNGIDINAMNAGGNTALILASYIGQEDIVIKLLSVAGIDINIQNNQGDTALTLALYANHKTVVKLLLACDGIHIKPLNKRRSATARYFGGGRRTVDISPTI